MTLYLIDANVLMTANNLYYGIDTVPEFWEWLSHNGAAGNIKIPLECYEEILDGSTDEERDLLFAWAREEQVRTALLLSEEVDAYLVQTVMSQGYAADLTDVEIEEIGRDPFLIAHALTSPVDRVVVTTEVSSPRKQRQNRKIPDVCGTFGISCIDPFRMYKSLGFSTRWRPAR
jgi:Domain of unknown function (DUF4411)